MDDKRLNPDELLARVQAEEVKQARGRLKIFFGAAPGVGKTYAMLEAGRKEGKAGTDVVVGYVEPHVRPDTQALVLGLDLLPRRQVEYRGTVLQEFDLEAALERRPRLILVDELAHTNAPGVTHAKRWQDVQQLLAAGIDVYTTLNVQHLESLNDVVAHITGVTVRETVPDSVFESADEVELVDLSPDDLLERLREGKVYIPPQAERAVEGFFRKGNLIALRELALRRMAERVNAEVEDYRRTHAVRDTWQTGERLLVCVGPSPLSSRLVRATRRIAASLKAPWVAVNVETPRDVRLSETDRGRLAQNLQLADQLGGETVTLSGSNLVEELLAYARKRNVTKIIVGKSMQPRWKELLRGSLVYDLTRRCGDIDVYVISGDVGEATPPTRRQPAPARWPGGYLSAFLMVALCTGIGFLMFERLDLVNIVMVYLLGVVAVSLRCGQGPSVLASFLAVAAFDFFFVPPLWSFAVSDTQYLLTFAVMLVTGLTISTLTARAKLQAESARGREERTAALYSLSRELAAVESVHEIAQAVSRHVGSAFGTQVTVLLPDGRGKLQVQPAITGGFEPGAKDRGTAQWSFEHGQKAGVGTNTLPGADGLYVPLAISGRAVGVLGVRAVQSGRPLEPDQAHLLEAFAGQAAVALERAKLTAEAEQVRIDVERERLRNSLLSAVSHDLRTPLAAIAGAGSTLLDSGLELDANVRRELLQTICDEAEALNQLVGNLLDMTRLEAGALTVHREWHSVEEMVGVVLNRLGRRLEGRPIKTELPADLPLVFVDATLIQQVLVNLLDNAHRYSPPGAPIELKVRGAGNRLTFEVADRGTGVTPGDEERVFEKFYRSPQGGSRSGVGLGLSICRGIVDLHGGRIWAENRDCGAVFRFTLPLEGRAPQVRVEEPLTAEAAPSVS
jgi:two-component system sensor histidine kinase KdpD